MTSYSYKDVLPHTTYLAKFPNSSTNQLSRTDKTKSSNINYQPIVHNSTRRLIFRNCSVNLERSKRIDSIATALASRSGSTSSQRRRLSECCAKTRKSLIHKDQEIKLLKQNLRLIDKIRVKRRPKVVKSFEKFLSEQNNDRDCTSCPKTLVSCDECFQHFGRLIDGIETGGYIALMTEKLIETNDNAARQLVAETMERLIGYVPLWRTP